MAIYRRYPNVAILRTFSKAHGLAGLRVGYLIAPDPLAHAVRTTSVPYAVNSLAQTAAIASLHAADELIERCDAVVRERNLLATALRGQGWALPHSEANVPWLPLGTSILDFAAACTAADATVHPVTGEGVRVTMTTSEANDAFLEIAGQFV
ncbi:Putative phenylalanine aminotransferase (plasmid) [Streptomyces sp. YIM 121038]|nr:Putative phenylalanine aminotransferase [Streptomyces sp. YIM 121038]